MKIDWKALAKTEGYKSLKAKYIKSITEKHKSRSKEEYLKKFNWVICRAKHYAYHTGKPIDEILTEWEANCSIWWYGYYQECGSRFGKLNKGNHCKPQGIRGALKYYRKDAWYARDPKRRHQLIMRTIQEYQKKASTRVKHRWTKEQRRRRCRFY